jgi:thioester reductase-like protein
MSAINDTDEIGNAVEALPKTTVQKIVEGGYSETKWVSEFLYTNRYDNVIIPQKIPFHSDSCIIAKAISKDVPSIMFRLCSVLPCDITDFRFLKNDHLILLLKDIIDTRVAPKNLHPVIPLPVDFIVDKMTDVVKEKNIWDGKVVNLVPPKMICWGEVLDMINGQITLNIVSYDAWVASIKTAASDRYIFPISTLYGINNNHMVPWKIGKTSMINSNSSKNISRMAIMSLEKLVEMICNDSVL